MQTDYRKVEKAKEMIATVKRVAHQKGMKGYQYAFAVYSEEMPTGERGMRLVTENGSSLWLTGQMVSDLGETPLCFQASQDGFMETEYDTPGNLVVTSLRFYLHLRPHMTKKLLNVPLEAYYRADEEEAPLVCLALSRPTSWPR